VNDSADSSQSEAAMIEAPETPHTPHSHSDSGGRHRWFDVAMAVAVLLVSTGSLYVALHTGHTMEALVHANERLVRAQSTPVLQYDHGNMSDDGIPAMAFRLTNVGTGAARIMWFEVAPADARYSSIGQWVISTGASDAEFTSSSINRIVLAANEERIMLTWPQPADEAGRSRWAQIDAARFETKVRACYCSVFDQCWQSNLDADIPEEVPTCHRNDG
jgi:hypothetical protein